MNKEVILVQVNVPNWEVSKVKRYIERSLSKYRKSKEWKFEVSSTDADTVRLGQNMKTFVYKEIRLAIDEELKDAKSAT